MTNPYESFTQKIQHAVVNVGATSQDQTIIAAPGAGKHLWVMGYRLVAQTAVNVQFKDTAGSTHSGTFHLGDLGELAEPVSPYPVAKLQANKGLVLNLSAAQKVGGYVTYRIVG